MSLPRTLPGTAISSARPQPRWQRLACGAAALLLAGFVHAEPPAAVPTAVKVEQRAFDLYYGRGTAVDYSAAAREFAVAARAGRPLAQLMLGHQLFNGTGVRVDMQQAFKWYSAAAQQGMASAQGALGWMYLNGVGSKRDRGEAIRWLAAAARQGEPRALLALSDVYARGVGVKADRKLALALLTRSAELGDPESCRKLGVHLVYGPPAQRDLPHGLQLLRKAAGMQDNNAAYALGWWYLSSPAANRELFTAAQWMSQSASANHVMAGLWLSHMYGKGLGLPQNPAKARELLEHALALADLAEKNNFAWQLSVNPDGLLRNGALAVRVMQAALATHAARKPGYLDTLAAAQAEAGDFEDAIQTQQAALTALRGVERRLQPEMRARLQGYLSRQPFRETQPLREIRQ